jgi:hypothetical protein
MAVRALLGLHCSQGERPITVLIEPQRLALGHDTAHEHRPGHAPGPRDLYFSSVREARIAEAATEKGTAVGSELTSKAASMMAFTWPWFNL